MTPRRRLKLELRGAVQGVGFRPFVFRLAGELRLGGWVRNTAQGASLEVEGDEESLSVFSRRLDTDKPTAAFYSGWESAWLDAVGYSGFEIRPSEAGQRTAVVLPDIATCEECRRELFDPNDRRFRYPFINCTHCGPRYSIIEALPYDRANTSMRKFAMCPACLAEYEDPRSRRFHAQPNACPVCGPQLAWWSPSGEALAQREDALQKALRALREGQIVALKGIGGFQLLVDARNQAAIQRLRERKRREEKPFALLCPNLEAVRRWCEVSDLEARRLQSPEAPIVLLRRRERPDSGGALARPETTEPRSPGEPAPGVAPGNPYLGVMLPYSPLHHLLMAALGFPVVATSGNLSDEPICIDENEAVQRLGGIADGLLVHDRPILRQVDDSVTRVAAGRELVLRRARGYAPLPIGLPRALPPILAAGAHLKNTVALAVEQQAILSQHIGDLDTPEAYDALRRVSASLEALYAFAPESVVCDAHPEYGSTRFAAQRGLPVFAVQHHFAHVCACMADNELEAPVLGVAWDGTGYGLDGMIWGGEFLHVTGESFHRVATWRSFKLPGGEAAIREPRRTALGVLYEIFGAGLFTMRDLAPVAGLSEYEKGVLQTMLEQGLNAPRATSVGRLFDAVASIADLRHRGHFEGQAAMELEFALAGCRTEAAYPVSVRRNPAEAALRRLPVARPEVLGNPVAAIIVDWEPMVWSMVEDVRRRTAAGMVSAKFHNTLAEAIVAVARLAELERVALTGGCFQNRYLLERAVSRLEEEGFRPYWHQRVPPNDGGIALGQLVAATRRQPTKA